jgi:molybdate transport system substrate-binding protein
MQTSSPRPFSALTQRRLVASWLAALAALAASGTALAEQALVAVAANFAEVADRMRPTFEAATGHQLVLTTGATGKLYAQIKAGAPFQVLLSADAATPQRLEAEGAARPGSRFTYAVGRLALWSPRPGVVAAEDGAATLRAADFRFIAIANPALAPYGVAAREVMQATGTWSALQPKLVLGENIGQAHAMVASGAADLGFVALSALRSVRAPVAGSVWEVPARLHSPLQQDAVLLGPGRDGVAARAFLDFLRSPPARALIESYGYGVE